MNKDAILLDGKPHDLGGGMKVLRILPQAQKRMVGPFIFFDHMGPLTAKASQNTDVRPHPHIGLSTLTYLFEGRIVHRDSLGSEMTIVPGEVNWMTAGRGISHSERTHEDDRSKERRLHGLQFWIALPDEAEDCEPQFQHYTKTEIPHLDRGTYSLEMIAGTGFGLRSKVVVSSPLLLARVEGRDLSELEIDFAAFEIAIYVLKGLVACHSQNLQPLQMLIHPPGSKLKVSFTKGAEFLILGGRPFETPRHIWWNLVSSSRDKIEKAMQSWKERTFPMVPGETEFIPAPEP